MGKIIKIIIIQLLILAVLLAIGSITDIIMMMPAANDPDVTGHPAPALTFMLPIFGVVVMIIFDIVMSIIGVVRLLRKDKSSK